MLVTYNGFKFLVNGVSRAIGGMCQHPLDKGSIIILGKGDSPRPPLGS